jgi:hypothetical protein
MRMCINYRALNKITTKNKDPSPRIDDLMDNLSGAQYFTSLDLTSGYHQLILNPSDHPKTAFNMHLGKYEWKVLPMGLTNAPAIFQSEMYQVCDRHLNKFLCVYLDNVLIFSRTDNEHLQHLEIVLDLLHQYSLEVKRSKCESFKSELKFLGHIVSAKGMQPDPAKVAVIQQWPTPQSIFDVRSFLELANYFRKYIQGYTKIAVPLTDLLMGIDKQDRKGKFMRWGKLTEFKSSPIKREYALQWTDACEQAFRALKCALISVPVLSLPDFTKSFQLIGLRF